MIENDYVMRLIDQLTRLLVQVFGLKDARQYDEALRLLRGETRRLIGLDGAMLEFLGPEMLRRTLGSSEKAIVAGHILEAMGTVYREAGEETRSTAARIKALDLYATVLRASPDALDGDVRQRALTLADLVAVRDLTWDERHSLLGIYETLRLYSRAEDLLFALLGEDLDTQQLVAEGLAFYDRLLKKSDDDLAAGSLPRDEVIESREQVAGFLHAGEAGEDEEDAVGGDEDGKDRA